VGERAGLCVGWESGCSWGRGKRGRRAGRVHEDEEDVWPEDDKAGGEGDEVRDLMTMSVGARVRVRARARGR